MKYDPATAKSIYNNYGDREWTRLERDVHGELLYHVHYDIIKRHIKQGSSVLEVGAGSGRYTKDLAEICEELYVADISEHQIQFNKDKMSELGLYDKIDDFLVMDMLDLSKKFPSNRFDSVICIGAPINYMFDKEKEAVSELLNVLKPGGKLILGSTSIIGALLHHMDGVVHEKSLFGIGATRHILETGMQNSENYPVANKHYMHIMRSKELDALFEGFPVKIIEKSSAGLLTHAGTEPLEKAKQDSELWELLLEKELEFTKYPGTLDCGMNIIYVAEKTNGILL